MSEAIGILIGIGGMAIGVWIVYAATRTPLRPWLRTWWLPKDYAGRESLERLLGLMVGAGFLVVGFLMCLSGFLRLFA